MENKVEIYINSGSTLDIDLNFGLGVTYNIDDIRNIENRNSSYSKTIRLPGTKKNNYLLGDLFDINEDFTLFNPNFKTTAKLLVNSTVILDGFLQLRNIIKRNEADQEGNLIYYDVTIYSKTMDFFSKIQNKNLEDLDFSDYNHIFNSATIISGWTNTWKEVYTYPMLYNGNEDFTGGKNDRNIIEFKPAIFHKAYLQQIAEEAGIEIGGSFWTGNTQYEKEIIPFNGPKILPIPASIFEFKAGEVVNSVQIVSSEINTLNPVQQVFDSLLTKVLFPDDSTGTLFDNGNNWDAGNSLWKTSNLKSPQTTSLKLEITADVIFSAITATRIYNETLGVYGTDNPLGSDYIDLHYNLRDNNNNIIGQTKSQTDLLVQKFPNLLSAGQVVSGVTFVSGNLLLNNIVNNNTDHQVKTFLQFQTNNQQNPYDFQFVASSEYPSFPTVAGRVYVEINIRKLRYNFPTNSTLTSLQNFPELNIFELENLPLNELIPKDILQSDLITDLVKRYNLYIIEDANNNKILLYTRDQYYSGGTTLDWTYKKDYSTEDNIEFIPELQNKKILFTYTEDDDEANKQYNEKTKQIYGQKQIEFDNEFVQGTKEIKTLFCSTPLIKCKSIDYAAIVPAIHAENPNNKLRVLYYGGLVNTIGNNTWTLYQSGNTEPVLPTGRTTYPYAGHFNDPINPTIDINFGETNFLYYTDIKSGTTNNLFNNYWRNYIEQINEGKLITSKFDLNEVDINFIKDNLNTKIFVKDSYYYINKIIDYDPTKTQLTEVELLKINDGISFEIKTEQFNILTTPGTPSPGGPAVITTRSQTSTFEGNNSESDDVIMAGKRNLIGSNSDYSIIIGSGNTIDSLSKESYIQGTNNKISVSSRKSYIVGDNNIINKGSFGSYIIGGDNNIIESGATRSYIFGGNNNIIRSGVTKSFIFGSSGKTINKSNEIHLLSKYTIKEVDGVISISGANSDSFFSAGTGLDSFVQKTTDADPQPLASGKRAISFGESTTNSGDRSIVGGKQSVITATGANNIAWGSGATISSTANESAAFGKSTRVSGRFSFAAGERCEVTSDWSTAFGAVSKASGIKSFAIGDTTNAKGETSFVSGLNSLANNDLSFAHGNEVSSTGYNSQSFGFVTTADTRECHSEGILTRAGNFYTTFEPVMTVTNVDGMASHSSGIQTLAKGTASFVTGIQNISSGHESSVVCGSGNTSSGLHSLSSGQNNNAAAPQSACIGGAKNLVQAAATNSVVVGGNNISASLSNTTYVPDLVIKNLTSTDPLATNAAGKVIAGVSDRNLKHNIKPLSDTLNKILKLNPISFKYNKELDMGDKIHFGLIGQDVKPLFPEIVKQRPGDEKHLSISYIEIIPLLIKAIQELKYEIDQLKNKQNK